ncbi:MAG: OmpP1/FadL family transporter [Pseudomarimonas sp.]
MNQKSLSSCIGAALLLAASAPALAITNIETNATIPFSFSNPGARSLAMGGAFLGLADDATAAYTNPAGLTRLGLSKQFSAEFRQLSFDTPYPANGSFGVRPFDLTGVNYRAASDETSELAFLSFVLPRDDWSIAFYRHQLLNYKNSYTNEQIFFPGNFTFNGGSGFFTLPYTAVADLSIESYGISFGQNITEALSWGGGIAYHRFEIDTFNERFNPNNNNAVVFRGTQSGDDNDLSFSFGLLYRGSDRFSIGLSYRSAPSFDYQVLGVFGDGATAQETANFSSPFKAPDSLGIGFSFRPTEKLTLSLDVNHVGYSNLSERVDDGFFSGELAGETNQDILDGFSIKDQIEPRMGMEYAFDTANPFFLRAGFWRESERNLRFRANPDGSEFTNDPVSAYAEAVLFSSGGDENHYALGFGWAFPKFQVDFAYDASDVQDTISLSGVLRWD